MPVSSTATVTPSAPGRPTASRLRQAPIASIPPGETGSCGVAFAFPGQEVPLLEGPVAGRVRLRWPVQGARVVGEAAAGAVAEAVAM